MKYSVVVEEVSAMIRRKGSSEVASRMHAPPLTSPPPSLVSDGVEQSKVITPTSLTTTALTTVGTSTMTPPMKAKMSGFKINDINFTQCQSADDPITIVVDSSDRLLICIEKLSLEFCIPVSSIEDITITGRIEYGESLTIDLKRAPEIGLMRNGMFSPSGLTSQLGIFKELLEVSAWPGTMQIHNVSLIILISHRIFFLHYFDGTHNLVISLVDCLIQVRNQSQGDSHTLLSKLQTDLRSYPSLAHMNIYKYKTDSPPLLYTCPSSTSASVSRGSGLSVLKKKGPLRILTPPDPVDTDSNIKEDGVTSGEGTPESEVGESINVEDFLDTLTSPELANYGAQGTKAVTFTRTDTGTETKSESAVLDDKSSHKVEAHSSVKSQVIKVTDPSPLRPDRLSFEGSPQDLTSSSSSSVSPASTSSEIEDLKIYLLTQKEIEARERELIKIELTKEKTRSRIIIGALGVGLGFTGLLLIKPEMQKTVLIKMHAQYTSMNLTIHIHILTYFSIYLSSS